MRHTPSLSRARPGREPVPRIANNCALRGVARQSRTSCPRFEKVTGPTTLSVVLASGLTDTVAHDTEPGYRLLPHTADVIVEAFGPSLSACVEAAVMGETATFADVRGVEPTGEHRVQVRAPSDEALLVAVLEEVIFLLDVEDLVVVRADLPVAGHGSVSGRFETVDKNLVVLVGSPPKAVSYHELELVSDALGYRCRFIIDV